MSNRRITMGRQSSKPDKKIPKTPRPPKPVTRFYLKIIAEDGPDFYYTGLINSFSVCQAMGRGYDTYAGAHLHLVSLFEGCGANQPMPSDVSRLEIVAEEDERQKQELSEWCDENDEEYDEDEEELHQLDGRDLVLEGVGQERGQGHRHAVLVPDRSDAGSEHHQFGSGPVRERVHRVEKQWTVRGPGVLPCLDSTDGRGVYPKESAKLRLVEAEGLAGEAQAQASHASAPEPRS